MPKVPDIREVIDKFEENHEVNLRYASYDFCYGYFQQHRGNLCSNMEYSCWVLWGYLASWGMLRGSSELLNLSPAALKPLIEYFDELGDTIWDTDVPMYTDTKVVQTIKDVHARIVEILENKEMNVSATNTLVTKIMMGVFGCVPAFDANFTATFQDVLRNVKRRSYYFNQSKPLMNESLEYLYKFYIENEAVLNNKEIYAFDFDGKITSCKYKIAKLIDMYGFSVEANRIKAEKEAKAVNKKLQKED